MSEWRVAREELPPPNSKVLAWLEGFEEHSDVLWRRYGMQFMVRWEPGTEDTDHQGWSDAWRRKACAALGADILHVTHWMPLPDPPEDPERELP